MLNKNDLNKEQVLDFELAHGRKPVSYKELVEDQEKAFKQLGGDY